MSIVEQQSVSDFGLPEPNHPALRDAVFERRGICAPIPILTPEEAATALAQLEQPSPAPEWHKGSAAVSRPYYDLAVHPSILKQVQALLGPDLLLWGARLVRRQPEEFHPWHTDKETAAFAGRSVSVWIGLAGTNEGSALQVIPGSHRFGISVQEAAHRQRLRREELSSSERVLALARAQQIDSEIVRHDMKAGQALFFDGALWHGSENKNMHESRTALLLQYATPDVEIRVPLAQRRRHRSDWPFAYRKRYRPPCLLVSGTDNAGLARIESPPGTHRNWIWPLDFSSALPTNAPRTNYPIYDGPTPCLQNLESHASVLQPGMTPHPAHRHQEEELLIVLCGHPTLLIGDGADVTRQPTAPGDFVYYPAKQAHTITNDTDTAVAYVMFRWTGLPGGHSRAHLNTIFIKASDAPPADQRGTTRQRLLEGPTAYLGKLHAHYSIEPAGSGYAVHSDPYDIALVPLAGSFETLGQSVAAHSVVFYARNEQHGLQNTGSEPARYLVFEFHRRQQQSGPPILWQAKALLRAAVPKRFRPMIRRQIRQSLGPLRTCRRTLRSLIRNNWR